MDLVGKEAHVPCLGPIEMQRKYPEHPLHLGPYARKLSVPLLLLAAKGPVAPGLSQDPVKPAFFSPSLFKGLLIIGLVGKKGFFFAFKKILHGLGVMDIGWGTDEFGDKLGVGINGDMVFVAIDGLFALFGESGIVIFSGASGGFDQAGVDDFTGPKLKALLLYLPLEFGEAFTVKIHGLEIRAEAGDSGVVRDGIDGRKTEEAAVEEVTFEHGFHFGVGMAVDLLDDKDLEHHDGIVSPAADTGRMKGGEDFFERFPIDEFIDARKDVFW